MQGNGWQGRQRCPYSSVICAGLRAILEHVLELKAANVLWDPGSSFDMNQPSS